jgi:hypothetical protein
LAAAIFGHADPDAITAKLQPRPHPRGVDTSLGDDLAPLSALGLEPFAANRPGPDPRTP